MGTRGFIGFIMPDGAVKGSYNHYDSYPTGAGKDLQNELQVMNGDLPSLLPQVEALRWVDHDDDMPTAEEVAAIKAQGIIPDERVSTGKDWYATLREQQGSWIKPLRLGIAIASHEFLQESLFCEWGWVIDFRTNEVVILRGFNEDRDKEAPYCKREADPKGRPSDKYWGCTEVWRGSRAAFVEEDLAAFDEDA